MSKLLVIILNGEINTQYNRQKPLAGLQRRFLEKMDSDMDNGFKIDGEHINNPNKIQRTQFVSNQIVNAILNGKKQFIPTGCAYLAKAEPKLVQIQIDSLSTEHSFNLIFDD